MLRELSISNFILIEHQSISFGAGLNVLSGETGAGKSIILQALEILLGGRPRADLVRAGAERWEVSGLFDLSKLAQTVRAELPELIEGDELLLGRSMTSSGKGKVLVNGRLATVGLLEEIAAKLIAICNQNQQVRLLNSGYHRELLDGFCDNGEILDTYRSKYNSWRELERELAELNQNLRERARREAELQFVVEELSAAGLEPGKRERLELELKRFGNSQRILERGGFVRSFLNSEEGILVQLTALTNELSAIAQLDQAAQTLIEQGKELSENADHLERHVARYLQSIDIDTEELEIRRGELAEIARLERKYRMDEGALVELLKHSEGELASLTEIGKVEALTAMVSELYGESQKIAAQLKSRRERGAKLLEKAVCEELSELNMKDARIKVSFSTSAELSEHGSEKCEFLITTAPGEEFGALRRVASGGELSRIMLVLKKILRDRSGVDVLVFDEVDTGISGGVARAVGEKLKNLASTSQVICITHLPQIASMAEHHFVVEKERKNKTLVTKITELSEKEKVEEIARMLAGYKVTDSARESARELLTSK